MFLHNVGGSLIFNPCKILCYLVFGIFRTILVLDAYFYYLSLIFNPQIYYLMYWYDKQITLLILSYLLVQLLS